MHAVSRMFEDPTAPVRFLRSGADMMMVCAHWTDTERCRGFAEAILRAAEDGTIAKAAMAQSKERIRALLARAPQNAVAELPADIFERHRQTGVLFTAETAEVI
jgi:beta-N-acetylhexosaminidase